MIKKFTNDLVLQLVVSKDLHQTPFEQGSGAKLHHFCSFMINDQIIFTKKNIEHLPHLTENFIMISTHPLNRKPVFIL